jgi:hypothetical protein
MPQVKRVRNYSRREPIFTRFLSEADALRLTDGCPVGYRSAEVERELCARWREEWNGPDGWLIVMRPMGAGSALPVPEMVVRMWSRADSSITGGAL